MISGWECDVFLPELKTVVEVDGEYWHRDKRDLDSKKTQALVDSGHFVVRVRDHGLAPITSHDVVVTARESEFHLVARVLRVLRNSLELPKEHREKVDQYLAGAKLRNGGLYRKLVRDLAQPQAGKGLAELFPDISDEWHTARNSPLTPAEVHAKSHIEVWWRCIRGHEWKAKISNRTTGRGCPFCASRGSKLAPEKTLAATRSDIAAEWHPVLNNPLTPKDVSRGSGRKAWWRCHVNPVHEWETNVNNRTKPNGTGCPFCAGKRR